MKDGNGLIYVGNIQRFSLHDGPGIRTTVFLIGCNLRCPWCCNPENLSRKNRDKYGYAGCEQTTNVYSLDELYEEICKDCCFYSHDGGVTFSGGEPLLQIQEIEPLLSKLKSDKIDVCFETSLCAPMENLELALKYANRFFVDVKIADKENFKKILKGDFSQYKANLITICKSNVDVTYRIPLTNTYTATKDNINNIINLLQELNAQKVELFSTHRLAENKYKKLDMQMDNYVGVTDNELEQIQKSIAQKVKSVIICKI